METEILSTIWFLGSLSVPITFGSLFSYSHHKKRQHTSNPHYHTGLMLTGSGVALGGLLYGLSAIFMTFSYSNPTVIFKIATTISLLAGVTFFAVHLTKKLNEYRS